MSTGVQWPPVSPHAALLSSPSGRKKYEAYRDGPSPMKRSATTPSLVDRLRAARTNNDYPLQNPSPEDDEEDEETLQLKLAAIEAKLKLKKLQKDKARAATPGRDFSRPSSSHGPSTSQIEVKASPTRRMQAPLPKSPARVLLGIDKGVRAADVSLKRANTTTASRRPKTDSALTTNERPISGSSAFNSTRSAASSRIATSTEPRKTFSERMSEARDRETNIEQRRASTIRNRSKGFGLDHTEMDTYCTAADSAPTKSPTRQYFEYSRDQILSAAAGTSEGARHLKKSRTMPNLRASPSKTTEQSQSEGDSNLYEGFSDLHLNSRILPHSFLKRTLPTDKFTIYRIPDLLKNVQSPAYELPDSVCDYVIFAVIASKSSPMDHRANPNSTNSDKSTVGSRDWEKKWDDGSRNQRRFIALTLTDLNWTVDLYLFGTAVPRYHRLTPGTVVAILNPGILPPKPGKSDTGAFSLSLSDDSDTVLEIGQARDLGYCKTLKKDGKECGSWINAAKTEICEWHLNAEIQRTKSQRMGVNTGSNGFSRKAFGPKTRNEDGGNGRGLLANDGRKYDREVGGHYYIASTGPRNAGGRGNGTSHSTDDPFIHAMEGEMLRPSERDARLRKHLAAQAKEREIADQLGSRQHSGFGFDSAGAEYLRRKQKARDDKNKENGRSKDDASSLRSAAISRTILSSGSTATNESRKRTAADVRLSPVKKTRFVTEKGIREAGRESLGAPGQPLAHASDSEDELEIV
ncbi:hypothetical protein H2200_005654 [Cladophialophora chaetospira]|uniref:Zinc finger Mcm10/DnaG-type domain-containing protein n=1 Tax=Cladophialophora chaetospira TaxID=386627 RepID=A0AA39CJT5_9EURO|nr:hypothetical protein H2200_005654 [Cladophialophora chaetospira]